MPAVPRMRIVIIVPISTVFIFFLYLYRKTASVHAVSTTTTCYKDFIPRKHSFRRQ